MKTIIKQFNNKYNIFTIKNLCYSKSFNYSYFNNQLYSKNSDYLSYYIRKNSWKYANINPLKDYNIDELDIDNNLKQALKKEENNYLLNNYLSSIGCEFEHIDSDEEKIFLYSIIEGKLIEDNFEILNDYNFKEKSDVSKTELINAFKSLCGCEKLEEFIHKKYPSFKRYSGEGINALIPLIQSILSGFSSKSSTYKDIVMSMGHRGRVNVLAMIFDYPVSNILYKIDNKREIPEEIPGIDDILTHIAPSREKAFNINGNLNTSKPLKVSMVHNPSHLEMTYPVAIGKVVAKRNDYFFENKDNTKSYKFNSNITEELVDNSISRVGSIAIHGDAAVSGQGVIYETLAFMNKTNHTGTVHIITNNQVGFTTEKSWTKPSDVFKGFDIPVVHVNGNDLVAVIKAGKIAQAFSEKYKKDIVINLIGWRKYGHNEVDEPSFTQPLMYKIIRAKESLYNTMKSKFIKNKIMTEDSILKTENKYNTHLNSEFDKSKSMKLDINDTTNNSYLGSKTLTHKWKNISFSRLRNNKEYNFNYLNNLKTNISLDKLLEYVKTSVGLSKDHIIHARLQSYYMKSRLDIIKQISQDKSNNDKNIIDWPTAETIAFASLLDEGYNVRISGQDVMRGTFSQRHLGLVDQNTNKIEYPLDKYFKVSTDENENNLSIYNKSRLEVNNSILSELGVILFEYGYSLENPNNFTIWEAQFGDFANTGQLSFDNFLACSEAKWLRQSGLTILLPHGFDGAGPDHSSSRIERFLQLINNQGHSLLNNNSFTDNEYNCVPTLSNTNMIVSQPTTAANYFHLLRRQMKLPFKKPLIVLTPKIGLRHIEYNSCVDDFICENKHGFKPIITNYKDNKNTNIKNIVFSSGQAFLNLRNKDNKDLMDVYDNNSTIFIRIEELAPFPVEAISEFLSNINKFALDANVYFLQEESLNAGAFNYCEPYLRYILRKNKFKNCNNIIYIGRPAQEAANGGVNDHKKETVTLIKDIKNNLL